MSDNAQIASLDEILSIVLIIDFMHMMIKNDDIITM